MLDVCVFSAAGFTVGRTGEFCCARGDSPDTRVFSSSPPIVVRSYRLKIESAMIEEGDASGPNRGVASAEKERG